MSVSSNQAILHPSAFRMGAVLLDIPEKDLSAIVGRAVDALIAEHYLTTNHRPALLKVLLHKYVKDPTDSDDRSALTVASTERRSSIRKSIGELFHLGSFRHSEPPDVPAVVVTQDETRSQTEDVELSGATGRSSSSSSSEATAVLVGAVNFMKQPTMVFIRLAEATLIEDLTEISKPVKFFFVLLGPFFDERDYSCLGQIVSDLMSNKGFGEAARNANDRTRVSDTARDFFGAGSSSCSQANGLVVDDEPGKRIRRRSKTIITPPILEMEVSESKPPDRDPLQRHGKLFHGLIEDIKDRVPYYLTDIIDGLNSQVIATTFFIFFAALSPAITFGGMYGDMTDNMIGVGETLLVSAINGIIFAVLGCQPLLIVGATGPLMVFDISLFKFCESMDIEYLPMRVWIGIWVVIFCLLITAFEALFLAKKITRYTEEIYATLICLIFIYEAFAKLYSTFKMYPIQETYCFADQNNSKIIHGTILNGTLTDAVNENGVRVESSLAMSPNAALLTLILMFSTFILAWELRQFRNSKFLGRSARRALGDFGVPISIFVMVSIDYLIKDHYTEKLTMPSGLTPSNPEMRGWLINPFGMEKGFSVLWMFTASIMAILVLTLASLEGCICQLILTKPERKLKKGSGFHWDLVLMSVGMLLSGIFGAPFMNPAVVRTLAHTAALAVVTSVKGESPKLTGVKEQRISGFLVSLLVGLSVFLSSVLNLVPKAVLLGVFLYMGFSAAAGVQFLERSLLFFKPIKYHPQVPFVQQVSMWKMYAFTLSQLFFIAVLWIVKQSPVSLGFPFVLLLIIPIRQLLISRFFSKNELTALEGCEPIPDDPDEEPDFYQEAHNIPLSHEDVPYQTQHNHDH